MTAPEPSARPTLLYVINSFARGGAEEGLLHLIDMGLFDGFDLQVAAIVCGDAAQCEALRARGVEPAILDAGVRMSIRGLILAFGRLVRLMARLRPAVVIGALPQANILARLASRLVRPRVMISFEHNTRLARRAYEVGFRLTSFAVDWMFADSEATAGAAVRRLYRRPPPRRAVVPLISFAQAAPPPEARAEGPLRLASAARFTPVKDQAVLIQAVARLRDQGRRVEARLYGDGPLRAECQALVDRLDLSDQVGLPGFTAQWWAAPADVFVLTSRHEGLSLAVLRALWVGLPVISTAVGDIAAYGPAAGVRLVPQGDPGVLASAIAALDDDPQTRRAMSRAGQAYCQAQFGVDAVRARAAALNGQLLAAAGAQGGM